MIGIYKITSPTGAIYIGQSIDIDKRMGHYKTGHCKKQAKLYASINKYGFKNHSFEILDQCLESELNQKEIYWIDFFDSLDTKNGLNLREGGQNGRPSEETKQKISKNHAKYWLGKRSHKKGVRSGHIPWNKGLKNPYSKETLSFIGISKKGNKYNVGRKHSRESIESQINKISKPIIQFDLKGNLIQEWVSAKIAGEELGFSRGNISSACCGNRKTANGYIWRHKIRVQLA